MLLDIYVVLLELYRFPGSTTSEWGYLLGFYRHSFNRCCIVLLICQAYTNRTVLKSARCSYSVKQLDLDKCQRQSLHEKEDISRLAVLRRNGAACLDAKKKALTTKKTCWSEGEGRHYAVYLRLDIVINLLTFQGAHLAPVLAAFPINCL